MLSVYQTQFRVLTSPIVRTVLQMEFVHHVPQDMISPQLAQLPVAQCARFQTVTNAIKAALPHVGFAIQVIL